MKTRYISLLVLLTTIFSISCNPDLVDEDPLQATEATFFNNADEFRTVLVGAYAGYYEWVQFTAGGGFGNFTNSTFMLPGDDLTERDARRTEVELFDGSLNSNQSRTNVFYESTYQVISRANVVIQKVRELDVDQLEGAEEIRKMEGEALFLRAFGYYSLFNFFGEVPIIDERLVTREDTNTPKSPAIEVISQAINDAEAAITSLPESWDNANAGRVTKNSARGLLAKALVFRANYNTNDPADFQAAITAYNAITVNLVPNFIDNFNAFTENNAESLYEIQASRPSNFSNIFLRNDGGARGVEDQSIWRGHSTGPGAGGFNDSGTKFFITEKLLIAYGTDPRINVFLDPADGNGGLIFQKYHKPDGVNDLQQQFGTSYNNQRMLRLADVKLCVAEALLKTGNTAGAVNELNSLRLRARNWALSSGVGDGTLPEDRNTAETDTDVVMQWIMDERWVELAGEGTRWDDLKRWHASGDVDLTGWDGSIENFSTALASPVQFDVNIHLRFPLPQTAIDRNSGITQNNPGY